MKIKKIFQNIASLHFILPVLVILGFFTFFGVIYAATYSAMSVGLSANNNPLSTGDSNGPHGCPIRSGDGGTETCDVDPGGYMTVGASLSWGAGFPNPLPGMGIGGPGLGYIPASYPLTCSASVDTTAYPSATVGNSNGSTICEIAFNNANAGNGSASYNIYVNSSATRGSKYLIGLTSNGGSNSVGVDFYVRVKPASCTITSFTCDPNNLNTLTWVTTNCSKVSLDGGLTTVAASGNMTHASFLPTSYTLTTDNGAYPIPATCGDKPSLSAIWLESGSATLSKTVSPGVQPSYSFKFWKVGSAPVKFSKCTVYDSSYRVIGNCNPYKAAGDPITVTQ